MQTANVNKSPVKTIITLASYQAAKSAAALLPSGKSFLQVEFSVGNTVDIELSSEQSCSSLLSNETKETKSLDAEWASDSQQPSPEAKRRQCNDKEC